MILIVGLGNPGEKHESSRHNVGFMVVNNFLKKLTSVKESVWQKNAKFNSLISKVDNEIILVKPLSYMNASGAVVAKIMKFYKIPSLGLYIIHDDLDLPLGKLKISYGHGSAGHKGVESIIQEIGSNNFVRIRVGIGSDKHSLLLGSKKVSNPEKYVLSNFEEKEGSKVSHMVKKATEVIEAILKQGIEKAANRYN